MNNQTWNFGNFKAGLGWKMSFNFIIKYSLKLISLGAFYDNDTIFLGWGTLLIY